jgi:hypothetical protein
VTHAPADVAEVEAGPGADLARLLPQHARLIEASGISPEVARARGYRSVTTKAELARCGFTESQRLVPTLLIPIYNVAGELVNYQHRPDAPRIVNGKPVKYETPKGSSMVLDVPPLAKTWLADPKRPLFLTEGIRKGDSGVSQGLCTVPLLGVWNWRGTNGHGGRVALPDWELIALNDRDVYVVFDSDVILKVEVHAALKRLRAFLENRGAHVRIIDLPPGPGGSKQGLDDFLANGGTVAQLLALATDELREPPRAAGPETPDTGRYRVDEGRICRVKPTRDGDVTEALGNFVATVDEEIILDDGAEPTRAFVISGRLDTGEPLPSARIPASRFGAMSWIAEHWGLRAVVSAGQATRDYLREAIQRLSPGARCRHVYAHTGWRLIDNQWRYLMAAGAVGRDDIEVDLGPELERFRLPRVAEDPVGAMRTSLELLRVAPLAITAPLWAAVYRAPLASLHPVDLAIWLEAVTGSLKSSLAALAQAHYGDFDRLHLPATWTSTANQLERRAFVLKDALFVVDDYAPSGLDVRELEVKAARLLRAQGNLAGRGRLRSDLSERPAFPPRGLIVSTGEQHPPGQSILARTLLVDVERGAVGLAALTEMQRQATRLPHAMAGYITWLAPQVSTLAATLREAFETARERAAELDAHLRIPEALAHLWLGLDCGLAYAEEIGACSADEAQDLRDECGQAFIGLGRAQGRSVVAEQPVRRFLTTLLALITQGRVVLLPRHQAGEHPRPGVELGGWQDDEAIYLIPEAAFAAVNRACREAGEPFPVRSARLMKDLAEGGLSECNADRHTTTARIAGTTRRVLRLKRSAVTEFLGEDVPSPVVTSITGSGE